MSHPLFGELAELDPAPYALPAGLESSLASPSLCVFMAVVRSNIAALLASVGGDPNRLRPHLKTTKAPALWRELLEAGLRHFKCATVREARVFLEEAAAPEHGALDLLVAYPHVGANLEALGRIAAAHPLHRVSVLIEDGACLPDLTQSLGVFIDINVGMNRTGIPLGETGRIQHLALAAGSRLRGLHAYEGHLAGTAIEARTRAAHEVYRELLELERGLVAAGVLVHELVTSGTPGHTAALGYEPFTETPRVHRISPGTVVLHDLRSTLQLPGSGFRPAALVFTRVISHPTADHFTLDVGSKALAAEAGQPVGYILGHPEFQPLSPSEEHLPVRTTGPRPERGTGLLLVPRHVCPTVNLAREILILDEAHESTHSTAPVSAGAHDLFA